MSADLGALPAARLGEMKTSFFKKLSGTGETGMLPVFVG